MMNNAQLCLSQTKVNLQVIRAGYKTTSSLRGKFSKWCFIWYHSSDPSFQIVCCVCNSVEVLCTLLDGDDDDDNGTEVWVMQSWTEWKGVTVVKEINFHLQLKLHYTQYVGNLDNTRQLQTLLFCVPVQNAVKCMLWWQFWDSFYGLFVRKITTLTIKKQTKLWT